MNKKSEKSLTLILFGTAIVIGFIINIGGNVFYKYVVEPNFYMQIAFLTVSILIIGFFMWLVNKLLNEIEKSNKPK